MGYPLVVCSYNMGRASSDYLNACKFADPTFQLTCREDDEKFNEQYLRVQEATAKWLQNSADIYCLQEVEYLDRPLIHSLRNWNYHLVYFEGSHTIDTVIALNNSRFSKIERKSFKYFIDANNFKTVAAVTAWDKLSKQSITIFSVHAPGYPIVPNAPHSETFPGEQYCARLSEKIKEFPATLKIIAGDFNSNPELNPARFSPFRKYSLHRTNKPTNVNPKDKNQPERELDFFLTQSDSSNSFFSATKRHNIFFMPSPFSINPEFNASDHVPLLLAITTENKPSTLSKIPAFFQNLFKIG